MLIDLLPCADPKCKDKMRLVFKNDRYIGYRCLLKPNSHNFRYNIQQKRWEKIIITTKPIIGYTDCETVKLDFDNTPFKLVKYWALRVMKYLKLEGFIILKSSKNCYHVVFNKTVSWSRNMHVVAWVSLLSHHYLLQKWFTMQCIKEASTLRVSPKNGKPSPRIVYRHGKQDKEIKAFLQYRKTIKRFLKNCEYIST